MFFSDVIGQEEIKRHLTAEARTGRVPHARLFCGPAGCGKLAMAVAYAGYLLCQQPKGDERCGTCPSCVKMNKLVHPDLHFVYPVIKRKGSSGEVVSDQYLSDWRALLVQTGYFGRNGWLQQMEAENQQAQIYTAECEQIQQKLTLKSVEGGRKVMIIWQPELMNVQGANKLLKLLEEPPADTLFLLVSDEPDKLLVTIQSRTQRVVFSKLTDEEVCKALQVHNGLDRVDAQRIARLSGGSYTKALEAIHVDRDSELFFELFASLMRLSYQRKIKEMMEWSEQVASWGRERQKSFLDYCQRLIRENFIYNFRQPDLNYLTAEEAQFSTRFARFVNERNVIGISDELAAAQRDIEQNVNPRMVFFDFALKMIVLLIQ